MSKKKRTFELIGFIGMNEIDCIMESVRVKLFNKNSVDSNPDGIYDWLKELWHKEDLPLYSGDIHQDKGVPIIRDNDGKIYCFECTWREWGEFMADIYNTYINNPNDEYSEKGYMSYYMGENYFYKMPEKYTSIKTHDFIVDELKKMFEEWKNYYHNKDSEYADLDLSELFEFRKKSSNRFINFIKYVIDSPRRIFNKF